MGKLIGIVPLTRLEIGRRFRNKHRLRRNEEARWRDMKFKYGVTKEKFYEMLSVQQGRCPICSRVLEIRGRGSNCVCVDHDHVTLVVRGLLCRNCNTGLGYYADSGTMHRAADYLAKHE